MKCPKCGHNHPAKQGMKCSSCRYQFTFNPKSWSSPGITDGKFLSYIRGASANDTVYFTRNHLYSVYCRKQRPARGFWIVAAVIAAVMSAAWLLDEDPAYVRGVLALLFCGFMIWRAFVVRAKCVKKKKFFKWIDQWQAKGHLIEKLIEAPTLHQPPPHWKESDIYDYGVEKIVIVERDILVDWMVLNNAHAQQKALVISESGYPSYLMPIAEKLLRENPTLPIHLLHDATQNGLQMEARIRQMNLPIAGHPITDLGMKPDDFKRIRRIRNVHDSDGGELEIDLLGFGMLAGGMVLCTELGLEISGLLDGSDGADDVGDFG